MKLRERALFHESSAGRLTRAGLLKEHAHAFIQVLRLFDLAAIAIARLASYHFSFGHLELHTQYKIKIILQTLPASASFQFLHLCRPWRRGRLRDELALTLEAWILAVGMGLADPFRPQFLATGCMVPGLYVRQGKSTGNFRRHGYQGRDLGFFWR